MDSGYPKGPTLADMVSDLSRRVYELEKKLSDK